MRSLRILRQRSRKRMIPRRRPRRIRKRSIIRRSARRHQVNRRTLGHQLVAGTRTRIRPHRPTRGQIPLRRQEPRG